MAGPASPRAAPAARDPECRDGRARGRALSGDPDCQPKCQSRVRSEHRSGGGKGAARGAGAVGNLRDDVLPLVAGQSGVAAATPIVRGIVALPAFPGEYLDLLGIDLLTNSAFRTFDLTDFQRRAVRSAAMAARAAHDCDHGGIGARPSSSRGRPGGGTGQRPDGPPNDWLSPANPRDNGRGRSAFCRDGHRLGTGITRPAGHARFDLASPD